MKRNFMLIDDSKIDLFINQKNIEKLAIKSNVKTFISAKAAYEYLDNLNNQPNAQMMFIPDIILLDINMPEMNGFQFLNAFSGLNNKKISHTKIYMLSSSTHLKDIDEAGQYKTCHGFISKPLTIKSLEKIIFDFKPFLNTYDFLEEDINPPNFYNDQTESLII